MYPVKLLIKMLLSNFKTKPNEMKLPLWLPLITGLQLYLWAHATLVSLKIMRRVWTHICWTLLTKPLMYLFTIGWCVVSQFLHWCSDWTGTHFITLSCLFWTHHQAPASAPSVLVEIYVYHPLYRAQGLHYFICPYMSARFTEMLTSALRFRQRKVVPHQDSTCFRRVRAEEPIYTF